MSEKVFLVQNGEEGRLIKSREVWWRTGLGAGNKQWGGPEATTGHPCKP